ncbi:MAG: fused MFS/spermidine synthase [Roseimicrobium sp.]
MSKASTKPTNSLTSPKASSQLDARVTHWLLAFICFAAGAAVMVIEISANRLLAPHFGNSIYTWTALIGVVLVALSAGAWMGGALADKLGRVDLLGWLLSGAAVLTMLIPALNKLLAPSLAGSGLISGPVFISTLLFALPAVLLGAVSPASVRFYSMVNYDTQVGHAAGVISMLGSLGSFVGTFLSGFFLLSTFGVTTIFLVTGILLLVLALVAFWMARSSPQSQAKSVVATMLAVGLGSLVQTPADARVVHRHDSFYHQIEVVEQGLGENEERYLKLDSTMEGGMRIRDGALVLEYQNFWRLAELNDDLKLKRALFIGAGAFGMPEELSRQHGEAHVDVVEIDPAVIEIGRRFFKLDEHPRVHAHASDARRFLKESAGGYDLIFGDAYNGVRHIPAHLVTREFFEEVESKLSAQGVFLMNVIAAAEGEKAELLGHLLATLRSVFSTVEAFTVRGAGTEVQNVILLAANQSWKPWLEDKFYLPGSLSSKLTGRRLFERQLPASGQVFSDDWNPVDAVIARQLLAQ